NTDYLRPLRFLGPFGYQGFTVGIKLRSECVFTPESSGFWPVPESPRPIMPLQQVEQLVGRHAHQPHCPILKAMDQVALILPFGLRERLLWPDTNQEAHATPCSAAT